MKPDPQQENPYAPPKVTAETEPGKSPTWRGRAILVGWLVDMAFSFSVSIVLGIVIGVTLVAQGVDPNQLQDALEGMVGVHLAGQAIGFLGTLLGAYCAARMGKTRPLFHALGVGVASFLTALVILPCFPEAQPLWASIIGMLLVLPAALLGGYLRLGQLNAKRPTK